MVRSGVLEGQLGVGQLERHGGMIENVLNGLRKEERDHQNQNFTHVTDLTCRIYCESYQYIQRARSMLTKIRV